MKKSIPLNLVLLLTMGLLLISISVGASDVKNVDIVWFSDAEVETETFTEIWDNFKNENNYDEYELNLIEIPYGSINDKIKTMVSAGEPPAMARTTDSKVGEFTNVALDITEKVGGVESFTNTFAPMLAQYYTSDNKVIAVPMEGTVNGMIYNKDLFDAAGVKVPDSYDEAWTWDEWEENVNKVIESQNTRYGLVWDYSPHRFSTLLYSFGGQIFNEDYSEVIINQKEAVESLEYFKYLADEKILDSSTWIGNTDPNNLFRTGQYPIHMCGSWMVGNYNNLSFDWGVMPFPYKNENKENHTSLGGGKFLLGFEGLDNDIEKVTKEFMLYVSKAKTQQKWVESIYGLPSNLNVEPSYAQNNKKMNVFAEQFKNIHPRTSHDWAYQKVMAPLYNDFRSIIASVLIGDRDPEEGMNKIKSLADDIMSDL